MSRDEKVAEAHRLRADGLSHDAIGARLGVTGSCVWKWLNESRTQELNRDGNQRRSGAKVAWQRGKRADERAARAPLHPDPGKLRLRNRAGEVIGETLVDLEDWSRYRHLRLSLSGGYARVGAQGYLHRLILELGPGLNPQCDHINRNRLDNRRANLRAVTPKENNANRGGYFARRAA